MVSLTSWLGAMDRQAPGPAPGFGRPHALLTFMTIGESRSIGRHALAVKTGLGEGSIRTILKRLKQGKYIIVDGGGCYLTKAGKLLYDSLSQRITSPIPLENSPLVVGPSQVAIIVSAAGSSIRTGLEQRDSSILAGAEGATTYVIKAGKFTIPGGSNDCEKDFPGPTWSFLRDELEPKNGDAVILCGARDEKMAKLGALSSALGLL